MYEIEKGVEMMRKTRWSDLADRMEKGDSSVVANSNEAVGLRWALKRRGKRSAQMAETAEKDGGVRVFCLGMMEN